MIKGGIKRSETDPTSYQFPKCSSPSRTHRFTELGGEDKGEGGDRGDLVEKKESPKRRDQSSQYSLSQVKIGTEDWVLKGTKLITNTKK